MFLLCSLFLIDTCFEIKVRNVFIIGLIYKRNTNHERKKLKGKQIVIKTFHLYRKKNLCTICIAHTFMISVCCIH